jgi:hypothetical protein
MRALNFHPAIYLCHAETNMRDPEQIEQDMITIGAMSDDSLKIEEIIAWCATHPGEIPVAIRILLGKVEHPRRSAE